MNSRREKIWGPLGLGLPLLGLVGLFLWSEWRVGGQWGLPLDDSWIHLQFARNLIQGAGFAFNPGEQVSASTAPLWTLILALVHLLPVNVVWAVKGLGVVLLWGNGLLTVHLGRQVGLPPWACWLAGLVVVLTPRLLWGSLSGMEVGLATGLATAGLWLHLRSGGLSYGSTVLMGLAVLARPECLLLFAAAVIDGLARSGGLAAGVRRYGRHLLLFAAVLAPFVLFNYATLGRPLPNTFYAKVGQYGFLGALQGGDWGRLAKTLLYYPVLQGQEMIRFSAENSLLLTGLLPLGLVQLARRRSWLLLLALVSFPLAKGVLAPFQGAVFQHGRYAAHLIPALTVVGLLGAGAAVRLLEGGLTHPRRRALWRWGQVGLWVVLLGNALVVDLKYAQTYALNVDNINDMHVAMGRWLGRNTPAAAVVATHDVGALGYFSGRRIIDTAGLMNPAILPYLPAGVPADEGVWRYLQQVRPDYLVILPSWYPDLAQRSGRLTPVHEIVLAHNTVAAGARMVAYRINWEGP
ncbi:MAG: hypothetical protein GKR89_01485 [Candidatus Latescibacteria bacterium]|nr:hypothetical protein [Candidatus Latescibacterota bacterium]